MTKHQLCQKMLSIENQMDSLERKLYMDGINLNDRAIPTNMNQIRVLGERLIIAATVLKSQLDAI